MTRIRELRKAKGLTLKDMSAIFHVSLATVGFWEQGKNEPSYSMLLQMSKFFNVPIDYILCNDEAVERHSGNWIPVYGRVAAGIPIEAIDDDIVDQEELTPEMMKDGAEYRGLRIAGHSMEPRIREGDVVIVRIQPDVESGEVAIVFVNGDEATCKQIKKTPEGVSLISFNPAFDPIFFTNEEIKQKPVKVWGKVVELRAKF